MSISLTNATKANVSLTNEAKQSTTTRWVDTPPEIWADQGSTVWALHKLALAKASKANLSVSNENKN